MTDSERKPTDQTDPNIEPDIGDQPTAGPRAEDGSADQFDSDSHGMIVPDHAKLTDGEEATDTNEGDTTDDQ